jgi:galactokinase
MPNPAQRATKLFVQTFGTTADDLYQAPGRINIMGEHTDYNEGLVLPVAINFNTVIAVKRRDDDIFRVVSDAFPGQIKQWQFAKESPFNPDDDWLNYLKGVTASMARSGLQAKGLDLAIVGNVPMGAGMSSSAALEVAFGTAISYASQLHLSPMAVAQLAQRGEHHFMGLKCGVMDQMISALAEVDQALLIDCADLEHESVAFPESLSIIVIDPVLDRQAFIELKQERQDQCEQINTMLGTDSLRHLSLAQLDAVQSSLTQTQANLINHVKTENLRTPSTARALQQNNMPRFSQLMHESYLSLRDDFMVHFPQVDTLMTLLHGLVADKGGVRFSDGCVIALVDHGLTDDVIKMVEQDYFKHTGLDAKIYLCSASAGASRIDKP